MCNSQPVLVFVATWRQWGARRSGPANRLRSQCYFSKHQTSDQCLDSVSILARSFIGSPSCVPSKYNLSLLVLVLILFTFSSFLFLPHQLLLLLLLHFLLLLLLHFLLLLFLLFLVLVLLSVSLQWCATTLMVLVSLTVMLTFQWLFTKLIVFSVSCT